MTHTDFAVSKKTAYVFISNEALAFLGVNKRDFFSSQSRFNALGAYAAHPDDTGRLLTKMREKLPPGSGWIERLPRCSGDDHGE